MRRRLVGYGVPAGWQLPKGAMTCRKVVWFVATLRLFFVDVCGLQYDGDWKDAQWSGAGERFVAWLEQLVGDAEAEGGRPVQAKG